MLTISLTIVACFVFCRGGEDNMEATWEGGGEGLEGVVAYDNHACLFGGDVEKLFVLAAGPVYKVGFVARYFAVECDGCHEDNVHCWTFSGCVKCD